MTQLGFRGALINGHTNGNYLDDDAFSILFDRAEALDVPIYLHPTDPPKVVVDAVLPALHLASRDRLGMAGGDRDAPLANDVRRRV